MPDASGLKAGDRATFRFSVSGAQTVPRLHPEARRFRDMPGVFATGFVAGLMERACHEQLARNMEDGEGPPGTHVDVGHTAPVPPGLAMTLDTGTEATDGRFVWFRVRARDGVDPIGEGRRQRAVVRRDRLVPKAMSGSVRAGA